MRVLFIVHGFPPRETAGTEQHAAQLATALRARGHVVHVFAATRAPGRPAYALLEEPGVTRIVVNESARPLAAAERDRAVEERLDQVVRRFQPEVAHVHHLQFLSSGIQLPVPTVATLHDQWAWCAAGGAGLLPDGSVCPGPKPARCATCHAAWRPVPGLGARGLVGAAGLLAPVIDPERLHGLYRRLPASLRGRIAKARSAPEAEGMAWRRNVVVTRCYAGFDVRVSPSAHLARLATERGLGPVRVLPHGVPAAARVPPSEQHHEGGPFLFLGTISRHKGPGIVVRAWRQAVPDGETPLHLHGPVVDAEAAEGHPVGPVLDRDGVRHALAGARALVLGSIWPENAPLVVLEALAAGCPVLAPDIGGLPEIVPTEGLYPAGDVEALAALMRRVIQGDTPPVPAPRGLDEVVSEVEAIYRELVPRD